ncbi:MAG TPA: porin, partial [Candidatus Sulfotelmatobacter sp.]|nr:porin [Candidatus Sulfotelmatobacter sp.]
GACALNLDWILSYRSWGRVATCAYRFIRRPVRLGPEFKSEGASMRKLLLASTALVGAVALTQGANAQQLTTDSPFTVRIDGFANFRGGITSNSNTTSVLAGPNNAVRTSVNTPHSAKGLGDQFLTDTEIHVTATGKADNGLVYGMYVEVEADPALYLLTTSATNAGGSTGIATQTVVSTSAQNYIDEANIFLQGSWGRVEMGDQDGASDQLFFGAPYDYGPAYGQGSGADGDIIFRWVNGVFPGNLSSGLNANPEYLFNVKALDSNDTTKITYLSPVISGFRAGVSFAPDSASNGNGFTIGPGRLSGATIQSLTGANIGVPGVGGQTAALPATGTPGLGRVMGAYGDYKDWFEFGGQWRGTVGDVGLGANVEYTHASHKQSLNAAVAGATNGTQFGSLAGNSQYSFADISSVGMGVQASYLGFTVGGSYSNSGRSGYITGAGLQSGQDAYAYVLGIQYAIGPWIIGYNYSFSLDAGSLSPLNIAANGGGSDIAEWHSVGAKYIVAPGLFLFTEYGHVRLQINGQNVDYANVAFLGTGIRF